MNRWMVMISLATVLSGAAESSAENWPQFRGPSTIGTSTAKNLPIEWKSESKTADDKKDDPKAAPKPKSSDDETITKNIAWKVDLPGIAWSSPIVWGDNLYVTTAIPEKEQEEPKKGLYFGGDRKKPRESMFTWEVRCYESRTGKEIWKKVAHKSKPNTSIHLKNTYASETPATDGEHLVAYFGGVGLYCYDMSGKLLWEKDLGHYKTRLEWGTASSPIIDDGRLYIQYDNDEKAVVLCYDVKSGKELWRADRDEYTSWATPFIWRTADRTELVTAASKKVRSYDPKTGKLLWELGGMSSIAVPTPFTAENLLFVSSGYVGDTKHRPLFAIKPGATGDLTLPEKETSSKYIAWCEKMGGPYMPTPLYYEGLIYVLYDRGLMSCYEASTGKELYKKQRLTKGNGQFTTSPWAYEGRIFCLSEDGDCYMVKAGKEFSILGKNSLGEMCMASPAISGDSLYIRTKEHLFCIRNGATLASNEK